MAVGTLLSRGTGFLRTIVIAAAIGTTIGDAYNTANTIPNIVYELLLGGVLTSVVVPLLVAAARRDGDGGDGYAQRLLTVVVVGLTVTTALAIGLAPWIIRLYVGGTREVAAARLAVTFARYFLPQILFYGVGALLGAILNVRGSFAPPMWAPVLNNAVVIVTGGLFIAVTRGRDVVAGRVSGGATLLLALGTTLGIVAQTLALFPALRRTGFRFRLRWDLRGAGLRPAAALGRWVLVYVLANQVAFLVITRLAFAARYPGTFTIYVYAFVLVSLPYAVVAVSVITALLPRMSASALDGRLGDVSADLSRGLKLAAVVLVPAELGAIALGPLVGAVLFAHHTLSLGTGRLIGATLAAYAVSLVPFAGFQMQLRAFYALRDTRTPALVNIGVNSVNLLADLVLFVALPPRERVVGLALGYSLSYIAGYACFAVLLRRRLGITRPARLTRTLVRLGVAGALAAGLGYAVAHLLTRVAGDGAGGSALGLLAGAGAATPLYVWLVLRMRIPEVREIGGLVGGRIRP